MIRVNIGQVALYGADTNELRLPKELRRCQPLLVLLHELLVNTFGMSHYCVCRRSFGAASYCWSFCMAASHEQRSTTPG